MRPSRRERKYTSIVVISNGNELRRQESTVPCELGAASQTREYLADGSFAPTDFEYHASGNVQTITGPPNLHNQRYVQEFQYDPEVIAGVLAHELEHWRNADAVSAAFVRGVALPLYLIHAAVGALSARTRQPLLLALVWLLTWPVLLTVRWFIMPVIAADARAEEFRADQGAVQAGYRDGLRRVLTRLDRSFETGHNGWTRTICQRHPAVELRLERLESPDQRYPLPDPAASPVVRTAPPPRSPR